MQIWRAGERLKSLQQTGTPTEQRLEELLESEPSLLGVPLLIIGRQVRTDLGKVVDLVAIDGDGTVHVIELKRDKAPRDVVAQALEYAAWAKRLDHEKVRSLHAEYSPEVELEVRAVEVFGGLPEELGVAHQVLIVASEVDAGVYRVIEYLQDAGVPVNVALFSYFRDGDNEYLARAWVVEPTEKALDASEGSAARKETWNGRDWYASFGIESDLRDWSDAQKFGFIGAGGGRWYSRTLSALPIGGRVFVCVPGTGYVGVGKIIGEACEADTAVLTVNGAEVRFRDLQLSGRYAHDNGESEVIVPVEWMATVPLSQAVWEKGMFANQNSACKLRNRFTLDRLSSAFGLED